MEGAVRLQEGKANKVEPLALSASAIPMHLRDNAAEATAKSSTDGLNATQIKEAEQEKERRVGGRFGIGSRQENLSC